MPYRAGNTIDTASARTGQGFERRSPDHIGGLKHPRLGRFRYLFGYGGYMILKGYLYAHGQTSLTKMTVVFSISCGGFTGS